MGKVANRALIQARGRHAQGISGGIAVNEAATPYQHGGVSKAQAQAGLRSIAIGWKSNAAKRTAIIGDPNGLIATAHESFSPQNAFTQAETGFNIEGLRNSLASNPLLIKTINIEVTAGKEAQFANQLFVAYADVNGKMGRDPINLLEFKRNNQQQPNLLTLEFPDHHMIALTAFQGIIFEIIEDCAVTMSLGVAMAKGRV